MLSRISSSIIFGLNIVLGLCLFCLNSEFYHSSTIEKDFLSWNMIFALIIILFHLILALLIDSLILSKRPHLFSIFGIICSIILIGIHLINIILFILIIDKIYLPISSFWYINLSLFFFVFLTTLFDWLVCYDLYFHTKS